MNLIDVMPWDGEMGEPLTPGERAEYRQILSGWPKAVAEAIEVAKRTRSGMAKLCFGLPDDGGDDDR